MAAAFPYWSSALGGAVLADCDGCCDQCPGSCPEVTATITFPAPFACRSQAVDISTPGYALLDDPSFAAYLTILCSAGVWTMGIGPSLTDCGGVLQSANWSTTWNSGICPHGTYTLPKLGGGDGVTVTFS